MSEPSNSLTSALTKMAAEREGTEPAGHGDEGSVVSWRSFHAEAERRLSGAGIASAAVDARRIVEEASGHEGPEYHLGLDEPATKRGVAAFDRMVERRLAGEPLQYVLGRWSFRTLDLFVDHRVLIPRPETEVVAGVALEELERLAGPAGRLVAVDLGTGSGAIGLSFAVERADTAVVITDVSADALQVARANLAGIGRAATRVTVGQGSWFDALPRDLRGQVHVVASNPPYVAPTEQLPPDVADWEPSSALIAPDHGRADLATIIDAAGEWLVGSGAIVLEMAPSQTDWALDRAGRAGFVDVEVIVDLADRNRGIRGRWPG